MNGLSSVFVCLLAFLSTCSSRNLNSRRVARSNASGSVNLVEFNIRGTIYGQCTYIADNGQQVSVAFEDSGDELIRATSSSLMILDPVSEARNCRTAATKPPERTSRLRSDYVESRQSLLSRVFNFQNRIANDERYVSGVSPRFINFVRAKDNPVVTVPATTPIAANPAASTPHALSTPYATHPGIPPVRQTVFSDFRKRLQNLFGGISTGVVRVPFPVLNIPVRVTKIAVPMLLPSFHDVEFPRFQFGSA